MLVSVVFWWLFSCNVVFSVCCVVVVLFVWFFSIFRLF